MKRLLYLLVIAVLSANHLLAQPAYSDTIDWDAYHFDNDWMEVTDEDLWEQYMESTNDDWLEPSLFMRDCDTNYKKIETAYNNAKRKLDERNYNKAHECFSKIIDQDSNIPSYTCNKYWELRINASYFQGLSSIIYCINDPSGNTSSRLEQGISELEKFIDCAYYYKDNLTDSTLEIKKEASLYVSEHYKNKAKKLLCEIDSINNYYIRKNFLYKLNPNPILKFNPYPTSQYTKFLPDSIYNLTRLSHIINDSLNIFQFYLQQSIHYYHQAEITLQSISDMRRTEFIEWVYTADAEYKKLRPDGSIIDTVSLYDPLINRQNQIGEYFFHNPNKLYYGLNHVSDEDTFSYAKYTMLWLMNQKRYVDALDFYDTIFSRLNQDDLLYSLQAFCLENLGYYGTDILIGTQRALRTELVDSTIKESINYINVLTHYHRQQYYAAKYYCEKILNGKTDTSFLPNVLIYRGACYDLLANRMSLENKREEYRRNASKDYHDAIDISYQIKEPIDPYLYARLGKGKDAVKLARKQCIEKDSILAKDYSNFENIIEAVNGHLVLAQIYCMNGQHKKALKSVREALSISHDSYCLSLIISKPFMEPIHDELVKLTEKYASQYGMKQIVYDTNVTIIGYQPTQGGVMKVFCTINGITVDTMIFDSGAAYIYLPKGIADTLRRNGSLRDEDYICLFSTTIADGTASIDTLVNLHSIKIGNIELHNVTGLLSSSPKALPLLGQSVLSNFIIEMSPHDQLLEFKQIKYKR